jgi:hypothetical protein
MIDFSNARVLQYNHSNVYFGEAFRYGTRKNIQVDGEIYCLSNESGVGCVWSGISGLIEGAVDYDNILLKGINFGPGRIDSISFSDGIDVRRKTYQASLTIFDSGNLFNLTGQHYSGLDLSSIPIHLLETFSESFDFSLNEQKEGSFDQSISIRFVSGAAASGTQNPKNLARLLASGLFYAQHGMPVILEQYPEIEIGSKKYFRESYHEITNECSFSSRSKVVPSGNSGYGITYTHSLNVDEDGIATVTEQGNIIGLVEPLWDYANSGFAVELPNSFPRASGVYQAYFGLGNLSSNYLILNKDSNQIEGTIGYSVTYSDNPNLYDLYTWEYTHEIAQVEPCIYTVSENGSVRGRNSDCSAQQMYMNAIVAWAGIQSGVSGRASEYYQHAVNSTKPLKLIGKSEGRSALRGEISYNFLYTDDPNQGMSGFRKVEYSVQDSFPVALISKYNIPGVKEIVQPANNSTVGVRSFNLNVLGDKTKTLTDYLNFAEYFTNLHAPTGEDSFINEPVKYNISPLEHNFSINTSWAFFGHRDFNDPYLHQDILFNTGDAFLLENGFFALLENGDGILLEF